MNRMGVSGAIAVLIAMIGGIAPVLGQAVPDMPAGPLFIEPEEREFLNSCSSCHGRDGKGAGFLAKMLHDVDPGDLTRLSAMNGGVFPLEEVFAVIDGREEVAAHGPRTMPVWGDRYMRQESVAWQADELNELRVRDRIFVLVYFLQSIQDTDGTE